MSPLLQERRELVQDFNSNHVVKIDKEVLRVGVGGSLKPFVDGYCHAEWGLDITYRLTGSHGQSCKLRAVFHFMPRVGNDLVQRDELIRSLQLDAPTTSCSCLTVLGSGGDREAAMLNPYGTVKSMQGEGLLMFVFIPKAIEDEERVALAAKSVPVWCPQRIEWLQGFQVVEDGIREAELLSPTLETAVSGLRCGQNELDREIEVVASLDSMPFGQCDDDIVAERSQVVDRLSESETELLREWLHELKAKDQNLLIPFTLLLSNHMVGASANVVPGLSVEFLDASFCPQETQPQCLDWDLGRHELESNELALGAQGGVK